MHLGNETIHLIEQLNRETVDGILTDFIRTLVVRPACCDGPAALPHSPPLLHMVRTAPVKVTTTAPRGRYFLATVGGHMLYASPALCHWLGTPPTALLGDGWLTFVHGTAEQKRIAARWLYAGQFKRGFMATVTCRTASGVIANASMIVRARRQPHTREIIGFLGRVYPDQTRLAVPKRRQDSQSA